MDEMEFNKMTLADQIKVISMSLSSEEFVKWAHGQVVGLAEHMESLGIERPYETAKRFVFNEMQKATNA